MPYRAPADRDEAQRAEAREIRAMEDEAVRRRRRATFVGVAALLASGALLVGFTSVGKSRPRVACHQVEIRWENAPHVPPSTYTQCREIPM